MLPSNMLLLNLILLISVTFSTPTGDNAHDPDWLGSDSGRITGYSEATRSVERTGHSPLTDRCGSIMEAIPSPALGSCRDA